MPNSDHLDEAKKILIYIFCGVPDNNDGANDPNDSDGICEEYEREIRTGSDVGGRLDTPAMRGINVVMVNAADLVNNDPATHIMCLVEYDPERIFVQPSTPDDECDDTSEDAMYIIPDLNH